LLNTAFLALSSITMEMARRAIFRELDVLEEWLGMGKPALKRALPWLAATLTLGTLFLIGQLVAWSQLVAQGFTFGHLATPPSFFFYLMTGFHAAHMVGGIGALIWCLGALGFYKSVERRQIVVDSTAWFWHTTGLVWLMLFAVLATS
jgi:cytochrome c oxidase subunit 3